MPEYIHATHLCQDNSDTHDATLSGVDLSSDSGLWFYPAGLYLVQCRKFKDQLIAAAEAAVHHLLDVVCTAARESNLKVFDQYQVSVPPAQLQM